MTTRSASGAPCLRFELGGLVYEVEEPPKRKATRTVVRVRLADHAEAIPHVDRLDFHSFKSREAYAGRVADAFGREVGAIMGHLASVLDALERAEAQTPRPDPARLTPERKAAAQALLEQPGLLDRAAHAMTDLGYVGEDRAKRLAYLVATSRLMHKPLSAILRAPAASGKSELLDMVVRLLPEEGVEFLSRITSAALYYAGADRLCHRLVVVDEQAGTAESDYALRTLQSKGVLRLATPAQGKTEPAEVHGPIAFMSGTTSSRINPENLSRCLELSLDDSPEQTARIQAAQRRAWAGKRSAKVDLQQWHDAQRLLETVDVLIPFAEQLTYPARTSHDRRGNQKLLGLVGVHALLHQHQRQRDRRERVLATVDDYAAVYELLRPLVEEDLDGLSPKAARAYRALAEAGEEGLTRPELSSLIGWSFNTSKRAVAELVEQELAIEIGSGRPLRFRLLDGVSLRDPGRLVSPDELEA